MKRTADYSFFGPRNFGRAALALALACASATLAAQQNGPASAELPDAPLPAATSSSVEALLDLQTPQKPQRTDEEIKADALMERRDHMLKMHERIGLITVIPIAAACITGVSATPDRGNYSNTTSRDVHVGIGGLAIAMYGATAYYAIRAPKISHDPARGGVKWHKYLIYAHAPGIILTPILGAMAYDQINSGQKVHGIASAHGAVADITAATFGLSILAVYWPIHIKH